MNLKEKQKELYNKHAEEEELLYAEIVKELFNQGIDIIASGATYNNDEGGSDDYFTFALIPKTFTREMLELEEMSDEISSQLDSLNEKIENLGLDVDLETVFSHNVYCEYDDKAYCRCITRENGTVLVEEASFPNRSWKNQNIFMQLLDQ